jgi:hypothetical protein
MYIDISYLPRLGLMDMIGLEGKEFSVWKKDITVIGSQWCHLSVHAILRQI